MVLTIREKIHIIVEIKSGWLNEYSAHLPFWEIEESEDHGFETWSSETKDYKIDTCRFLAERLALLG